MEESNIGYSDKIKEEQIKEEPEEEESSGNLNNEEEEEDGDNKEQKEEKSDDSLSMDIDEERYTLVQIREFLKKKRLKKEKRSLLPKKQITQNITFDANTKTLRNCFIPDLNQLKEFLDNCVIKEIVEDEPTSFIKEQKLKVFDPQEFMLSNGIFKNSLSVEDLSLVKKKNTQEKIPELLEEKKPLSLKQPRMERIESRLTSIYKSGDKEKIREQFNKIRKIMGTDVLTPEQKRWLSDFIKTTSALPLEEIKIQDKKFEIVFDLDNTCVFSYLCNGGKPEGLKIKSKYFYKNIRLFEFEYRDNLMYSNLIFRQGLKEFVEYVEDLANFHVSTLAAKNYGETISNMLEELFKIKFKKFSSRIEQTKNKKYLNDLNVDINLNYHEISESNTIIFDDSVNVWENESFNVIASKKFYDKDLKMVQFGKKKETNKSDLDNFLEPYCPFSYNKIKEDGNISWKNQAIVTLLKCPFYSFKNKDTKDYNESFLAEYFDSPKFQFIYMKNVIKVLYCLVFHNDLEISNAIKLVRLNTLNGKKFYLKYLTAEQRNILRDIIHVCGGEEYLPPKENEDFILDLTQKLFLVVSQCEYDRRKLEIKDELKNRKNFVMINEKFILDSYYFMTDLEDSYTDKEYTYFGDDEK